MSFDLNDLDIAYRKAKVDLYYSSHASWTASADYEEQLSQKLTGLTNIDAEYWVQHPVFLPARAVNPVSVHDGAERKTL